MNGSPGRKKAPIPWSSHEAVARPNAWNYILLFSLGLLFVWSYRGSEIHLSQLLSADGIGQIGTYAKKLFPPDFSAPVLHEALKGALETFAISFLGTFTALLIALAAVFFASRNLIYSGLLYEMEPRARWQRAFRLLPYLCAKGLLNLLRTIPEMVWALIFVFLVGLGPFAGALALGFHTGGVLGKLFGEVLEDVDMQPVESLQSTGAGRLQILFYGVLPQVFPQFISYSLYRWEVNIRVAAVLGLVGAGGLGQRIYIAVSLFLENQLLTFILFIYVLVTAVDYLSAYLRRKAV